MLQAVKDWFDQTKIQIGVKPAGGIKTAKMPSSTWSWSKRPPAKNG